MDIENGHQHCSDLIDYNQTPSNPTDFPPDLPITFMH